MTNRLRAVATFAFAVALIQFETLAAADCNFLKGTGPTLKGTFAPINKQAWIVEAPRKYLATRSAIRGDNLGTVRGLLIFASRQTLKPHPSITGKSENGAEISDRLSVLIEDRYPLEVVRSTWLKSPFRKASGDPIAADFRFGLAQYVLEEKGRTHDFYFHERTGRISDFIVCSKPQPRFDGAILSVCRHYTETVEGIPIVVDYSRDILSEWQFTKVQSERLVACLVVGKTDKVKLP